MLVGTVRRKKWLEQILTGRLYFLHFLFLPNPLRAFPLSVMAQAVSVRGGGVLRGGVGR